MSTWFIYIVHCSDGSLYTGISTDVERRIIQHNEGKGAAYTRSRRPVQLVWSKKATSESAARKLEAAVKSLTRPQKESLVYNHLID